MLGYLWEKGRASLAAGYRVCMHHAAFRIPSEGLRCEHQQQGGS